MDSSTSTPQQNPVIYEFTVGMGEWEFVNATRQMLLQALGNALVHWRELEPSREMEVDGKHYSVEVHRFDIKQLPDNGIPYRMEWTGVGKIPGEGTVRQWLPPIDGEEREVELPALPKEWWTENAFAFELQGFYEGERQTAVRAICYGQVWERAFRYVLGLWGQSQPAKAAGGPHPSTAAKVREAHELRKQDVKWDVVGGVCDRKTYRKWCKEITGDDPI